MIEYTISKIRDTLSIATCVPYAIVAFEGKVFVQFDTKVYYIPEGVELDTKLLDGTLLVSLCKFASDDTDNRSSNLMDLDSLLYEYRPIRVIPKTHPLSVSKQTLLAELEQAEGEVNRIKTKLSCLDNTCDLHSVLMDEIVSESISEEERTLYISILKLCGPIIRN